MTLLRIALFILINLVAQVAFASPQRIASVNLCTDQYLLLLADRDAIASVTWLSRDNKSSYYYQRALTIPINHGEAEELIALKPDLIVAGNYTAQATIHLLKQLGYRVELFEHPRSIDQIIKQLLRMGALIGQSKRAEAIVKNMRQRLQNAATKPASNAPTLMQYAPGGFTEGRNTLVGDIMYKAGWRNKANDVGIKDSGVVDLETLLLIAPLALIDSPLEPDSFSFAEKTLKHPVLMKATRPQFTVSIDNTLWICGGPMAVDAVIELRKVREAYEIRQGL